MTAPLLALVAALGMEPFTQQLELPPTDPSSFTTLAAAFPADTPGHVDGLPLASRLLAATGHTVYLWKTFGGSEWMSVARLATEEAAMDPAFLAIAPGGEKIALGTGLARPLWVFPWSALSARAPLRLEGSEAQARAWHLDYYSGAFRDGRYLFINAGGKTLGTSDVYAIDTEAETDEITLIVSSIPGASAGIAFDGSGNLVTGIGWDPLDERTGEIKIFGAAEIDAALTGRGDLDYESEGHVVATGVLSAAFLAFDDHGNLIVGGGDVFGSTGNFGYAAVIDAAAVQRAAEGGAPASSDEITELDPDPCRNDDSTQVVYVPGVDMLLVSANMSSLPPDCEEVDWSTGETGPSTVYFPPDAPDQDGDGIPDGMDPDFGRQRFFDALELSRLVDALDSKPGDPNFTTDVDYNEDGFVNAADLELLRLNWGLPMPTGSWGQPPSGLR